MNHVLTENAKFDNANSKNEIHQSNSEAKLVD